MAENTQTDVKKLSFERAIEELESIVKRLEDGKVPLEESVAIYERGESLKRRCEARIHVAPRQQVGIIGESGYRAAPIGVEIALGVLRGLI
jgi:exodeoxyribonuclease VII small subunit